MANLAAPKRGDKEIKKKITGALQARNFKRVKKLTEMLQNRTPLDIEKAGQLHDPQNRLVKSPPKNLVPLRRNARDYSKDTDVDDENDSDSDGLGDVETTAPGPKKESIRPEVDKELVPETSKPEPPGGFAPTAQRKPSTPSQPPVNIPTPEEPTPGQPGSDEGGDESENEPKKPGIASNRINQAREWLSKKLSKEIVKKFALALVSSPWTWLVVGILLILIIGIALFTNFFGLAGRSPSESGQSMVQAADPTKDTSWIAKFAQLSGMKDIKDADKETFLKNLTSELTALQNDSSIKSNTAAQTAIADILKNVTAYENNPADADAGQAIIDDAKKLFSTFDNLMPSFASGTTVSPLKNITGFNNTLHNGTKLNPEKTKGHGTYIQYQKDTCDAVDLDSPRGIPVYAAFGGTLTNADDQHGHRMARISYNGYEAIYADLENRSLKATPDVSYNDHKKGTSYSTIQVKTGDQIGTVGPERHVHFELAYQGRCVVTTVADKLANPTPDKNWGSYTWAQMKKVLNLP